MHTSSVFPYACLYSKWTAKSFLGHVCTDTKRKHAEFQRLRKAHYHMEVIPKGALRAASSIDEEDDEDDDEDDGGVEDQSGMAANDGDDEYDDDGDDDNAAGDGDIETPRTGITAPAPSPRRPDVHMAQ